MADPTEHSKNNPVLVLAADEGFALPLAVTVRSILDSFNSPGQLELYILDGGISAATKERLVRSWSPTDRYRLHWVPVDQSVLAGLAISDHVSHAAYYRILMSRLMPADVNRVIYLDSDLLVLRDVSHLWQSDLAGNLCLAIQEFFAPYLDASKVRDDFARSRYFLFKSPIPNFQELGFTVEMPYFNSGVMVIDLAAWRELDMAGLLLDCLHTHREHVLWWDQYALNVVLARRWGQLDPRWNQGSQIFKFPNWSYSHLDKAKFQQVLNAPYIIHFTSPDKPWQATCLHPRQKEFYQVMDRTDWAGWRPEQGLSFSQRWRLRKRRLREKLDAAKLRSKLWWEGLRS